MMGHPDSPSRISTDIPMPRTFLLHLLVVPSLWLAAAGCDSGSNQRPDDTSSENDHDGDGYANEVDCDDENPAIHPDADEVCDELDNDCDEAIDEGVTTTYYQDNDADGYGNPGVTVQACQKPSGYVTTNTDCDDTDALSYPMSEEVCDGKDNDCDEETDEGVGSTWYRDSDADTYGDPAQPTTACDCPEGYVADNTDCDDSTAARHPLATEICDDLDNDCDGSTDEDAGLPLAIDADGDGFGSPGTTRIRCEGVDNELDCDDTNPREPVVVDAETGSPSGAGTRSSPLDTVQAGIDAAMGCVVVYPGTYNEALHLNGLDISLTGIEGSASTIIDAAGFGGPALKIDQGESSDTVVAGFTITNGEGYLTTESTSYSCGCGATCTDWYYTYCGGGVYLYRSSPTFQDLVVAYNELPVRSSASHGYDTYYVYSFGGGFCLVGSSPAMEEVDLWANYADQGGGLWVDEDSTVTFEQGWIVGNSASVGGGWQLDGGQATLTNVASLFNEASDSGGGLYMDASTVTVTNASFAGDDAVYGGGAYVYNASTLTMLNSIVYGAGTGAGILVDRSSRFSGTYNDVFGNAGGNYSGTTDPTGSSGNISSNPRFTTFTADGDLTDDDLTLTSSSPCINTGNPSAAYNDADGSRNDMGAFGGPEGSW